MLSKDPGGRKPQVCKNIEYEPLDCANIEILAYGPRTKHHECQRAAKRRKVEALAEQYLQGKPIYIRSVLGPFDGRWINPWNSRRSKQDKGSTLQSQALSSVKNGDRGACHAKGKGFLEIASEENQAVYRGQRSSNKELAGVSKLGRSLPQLDRQDTVTRGQELAVKEGSHEFPAGRRITKTYREVDTWLRKLSEAGPDSFAEDEGQGDADLVDQATPSRLPQLCQGDRDKHPSQIRKIRGEVPNGPQESSECSPQRRDNAFTSINTNGLIRSSKQIDHGKVCIPRKEFTDRIGATSLRVEEVNQGVREASRRSKYAADYLERDSELLSTVTPANVRDQEATGTSGQQRDANSLAVETSLPRTTLRTMVGQGQGFIKPSRKQVTPAWATGAEPLSAAEAVMQARLEAVPPGPKGASQSLPPSAHLSEFKFRRTKALSKPRNKKALTGPQSVEDNTFKSRTQSPCPMSFPPSPRLPINQPNDQRLPQETEASDTHDDALMTILTETGDYKLAREEQVMVNEAIPNMSAASATTTNPQGNSRDLQTSMQTIRNPATASPERRCLWKETTDSVLHDQIANAQEGNTMHLRPRRVIEQSGEPAPNETAGTVVAGPVILNTTAAPLDRRRLMSKFKDTSVRRPLTPKTNNVRLNFVHGVYTKQASPIPHPFPPQESNFCTQAAMLDAEKAFQAGLESAVKGLPLPLHDLAEPLQSVKPHCPSEPIKLFRAFERPLDEASDIPMVSTQQLFDEADLNFGTVKKPKESKRASFASSPTVGNGVDRSSDGTAGYFNDENNNNNSDNAVNVPTLQVAEQVADALDTPGSIASASVSELTESTNLTAPSEHSLLPQRATSEAIDPPSTTLKDPDASLDERTRMPQEDNQLSLADEDLDATVNCLDKYLNTLDVETEARNMSAIEVAKSAKMISSNEIAKPAKSNDDSSLLCTSIKKTAFLARRGGLAYNSSRRN